MGCSSDIHDYFPAGLARSGVKKLPAVGIYPQGKVFRLRRVRFI
jgi:hypothetical protein